MSRSLELCGAAASFVMFLSGLVSVVTVRSAMGAPRIPAFALRCSRATVAAVFKPLNVPVTESVLPFSVAVAEPDPATDACIATSIGTIDNRARYCGVCAGVETAIVMTMVAARAANLTRVIGRHYNAPVVKLLVHALTRHLC